MQGSREKLCVSDAGTVPAPLEAAWETIRQGLRRDCGARTFDGWLKPAELGAFDGESGELEIVMPSQFMADWVLSHFGDRSAAAATPATPCCDVCTSGLLPVPPPPDPIAIESLDDAILSVATGARPAVGRTTCAEILHGGRSKKLLRNAYDGLPAYGVSSHMRRGDILARVDELIEAGRLETSGGPYPVLRVPVGVSA